MSICPDCKQPIKESVVEGRKLIAQVNTGPNKGSGRFVTVLSQTCGCGERITRRYENEKLVPVGH